MNSLLENLCSFWSKTNFFFLYLSRNFPAMLFGGDLNSGHNNIGCISTGATSCTSSGTRSTTPGSSVSSTTAARRTLSVKDVEDHGVVFAVQERMLKSWNSFWFFSNFDEVLKLKLKELLARISYWSRHTSQKMIHVYVSHIYESCKVEDHKNIQKNLPLLAYCTIVRIFLKDEKTLQFDNFLICTYQEIFWWKFHFSYFGCLFIQFIISEPFSFRY